MKKKHYCTISGTGPAIDAMAGAFKFVRSEFDFVGFSGASGGALLAACGAFYIPDDLILRKIAALLDGRIIKLSTGSIPRGGLLDWTFLEKTIDEIFGVGACLGDADLPLVVCVTDLDSGTPKYLSKLKNPNVKLKEALIASTAFMALVTPAIRIPSLGTDLSPDIRLFCDGGWTDNTVDHVFDSKELPRVSLRLMPDYDVKRVREGDVIGIHRAVFRAGLYAQSLRKSSRLDGTNIDIPIRNNWDFSKNFSQVESAYNAGYNHAKLEHKKQQSRNSI